RRDRDPNPGATADLGPRKCDVQGRQRDRGVTARPGRTWGNREENQRGDRQNGLPQASVGPRNRRDLKFAVRVEGLIRSFSYVVERLRSGLGRFPPEPSSKSQQASRF